jgi:hypothetical protein
VNCILTLCFTSSTWNNAFTPEYILEEDAREITCYCYMKRAQTQENCRFVSSSFSRNKRVIKNKVSLRFRVTLKNKTNESQGHRQQKRSFDLPSSEWKERQPLEMDMDKAPTNHCPLLPTIQHLGQTAKSTHRLYTSNLLLLLLVSLL